MKLSGTKTGSINQYNGLGDQLYDIAGERPTLDLNFADKQSLNDQTTGKSLVTHTRASNATYVGGDGLIKDATTNLIWPSEDFSTTWVSAGVSVTADAVDNPYGDQTADTITATATSFARVVQNKTINSNTFVLSIYAKAGTAPHLAGTVELKPNLDQILRIHANLSTGVTQQSTGVGTISATSGSEQLANGWWRFYWIVTTPTTGSYDIFWAVSDQETGVGVAVGKTLHLWGTQLEEASTLGEYVKTTSTKNSAPRFDHDPETGESLGLLVEESRTNIHKTNHTGLKGSGTSSGDRFHWDQNSTDVSAPDGTSSTFKAYVDGTETAPTLSVYIINTVNTTYTSTNIHTSSVFIKPVEETLFKCQAHGHYASDTDSGTAAYIDFEFDLSTPTGSVTYIETGGISASVTPYPNGWYRCTWTYYRNSTNPSNSLYGVIIYPGGSASANDLGVGTLCYIWGPQVEEGSFPTSYIRTNGSTKSRNPDITQISGNDFGTFNLLQYSEGFHNYNVGSNTTRLGTVLAPNGTMTATVFTGDGSGGFEYISDVIPLEANTTYTTSCYAKLIEGSVPTSGKIISAQYHNGSSADRSDVGFNGNLTTEWQRFETTFTNVTAGNYSQYFVADQTNTAKIAIWGAQTEKSSTATPYVKSDVTWTSRGSNATYYDKDGVLRKSSQNLLTYSEGFTNAAWVRNGTASVVPGFEAPDGSLTAFKATYTNLGNGPHIFSDLGLGDLTSGYRRSVWVKVASGTAQAHILGRHDASNSLVTITDQWQRFELTITDGSFLNGFYLIDFRGSTTPDVDFYFWGAQLETGTYAGDYAKTEGSAASTARTNAYLPDASGNFVSAGELLLEGAGTNLLSYSEEFDNSGWTQVYLNEQITANSATAPNGLQTADTITTVSGTLAEFGVGQNATITSDVAYTYSIFAKSSASNFIYVRYYGGTSYVFYTAIIDLSSGTITKTATGSSTTNASASVMAVGNGWYRISLTATHPGRTSVVCIVGPAPSSTATIGGQFGNVSFTGSANQSVLLWGAQLEQSSYATSYIPTQGSTATRAADVSSSSSNTFGNSWYNQDQGTVFAEYSKLGTQPASTAPINGTLGTFSDGSSTNSMSFIGGYSNPNQLRLDVSSNSVVQSQGGFTSNFVPNVMNKLAAAITANNLALSFTGTITATQSSVSMPLNIDRFEFGVFPATSGHALCGHVKQFTYWPTRLSNETLTQITEPKAAYDLSSLKLDLNFAENKSLVDNVSGNDLVTFARSSNATYVGSDGLIKHATTNLLLRSEEFGTTWSVNRTTVSANAITAPDGKLTADAIIEDNTSGTHGINQTFAIISGLKYTLSAYLKFNGRQWAFLQMDGDLWDESGDRPRVWVDLQNGVLGSSDRNSGVSIAAVGDGWYRVSITATANTNANSSAVLNVTTANGNKSSYTGDGTSGIYLWGAQLEQSTTVGEYIPTTSTINSAPRFDHDPTTGESLGLLVEEQRVNNLVQSENFSATWTLNAVTVGASITAPNGTTTAQKLEETATTAEHRAGQPSAGGATTAAVTFSVFAKAAERTKVRLVFSGLSNWTGGGGAAVIFDLSAGTAVTNSSTPTAFSITPFANGWYRCSITGTPTSSLTPFGNIFLYTTTSNYAGTLGDGIYLWGAQLEVGSFPTSYIRTSGSTATRAADIASITGTNFSGFYNQSEGTVFSNTVSSNTVTSAINSAWGFDVDATNGSNRIWLYHTKGQAIGSDSGLTQYSLIGGIINAGQTLKVGFAFKENDIAYSQNSATPLTDASATLPTVNRLYIGKVGFNGTELNGTIKRLSYWNDRLSNDYLTKLTS